MATVTRVVGRRLLTGVLALLLTGSVSLRAQDSASASVGDARDARFVVSVRNRMFRIPRSVVSGVTIQPTLRLQYAILPRLRLAIDAQTVDNSGPGRQGSYLASRTVPGGGSGNFLQEIAVEAMWRLLGERDHGRSLAVIGSASFSTRSYFAIDTSTGAVFGGNRRRVVPTLALEGALLSATAQLRGALVGVFLSSDDALYVRRIPGERASFGPVIGPELQAEHLLTSRATAWGRGFLPMRGNNGITRSTGAPARVFTYDAGIRFAIAPSLALEAFLSNALGNTGALAYVADREYLAIGSGVRVRPGASDGPAPSRRGESVDGRPEAPLALAALAPPYLDRGSVGFRARWGSQGLFATGEAAIVRPLQVGVYTDLLRGTRDEGEVGALARLALAEWPGATFGLVLAASRTNNPLVNLLAERWDELQRLDLPKGGFRFGDESLEEGRLYTVTGALTLLGRLSDRTTLSASPLVGYVQRRGVQVAGLAIGAQHAVAPSLHLAAESGLAVGRGNQLNAVGRSHAVPWLIALGWQRRAAVPRRTRAPIIDLFVTNRAGDSPFHMLRVKSGGDLSAGIGVRTVWP
ncbi:MAG: hypothetical protein ABI910_18165 [Gemmatimonadota bacterium]